MKSSFFLIFAFFIFAIKSDDSPQNDIAFIEIGSFVGSDFAKKYYAPRYFKATHSNARSICRAYHMDFAMIESTSEFNVVRSACKKFAHLLGVDWVLVDGMTLTPKSPTDWYFTRTGNKIPFNMTWAMNGNVSYLDNNEGMEFCLSLGPKNVYQFNDSWCEKHERPFLCEKRASFKRCN